jgi:WhiB family transcriptional regulator, redox-sensing transcriptional regulator
MVRATNRDGWMAAASCKDRDSALFFPSDGMGVLEAQTICSACPVQSSCLSYALDNGIVFGVWGGVSERGRRDLRQKRRRGTESLTPSGQ